jgi:alpha-tubulin suppressor-like RCC1 family protein
MQRGAIASRPILSIVMGTHHAMALTRNHYYNAGTDTAIFSWGFNQAGQLGDGTNTNRMYPDSIILTSFNGKTMSMMAAGGYISMVLNTDSSIYAWGTLSSIANSTMLGMGDGAGVARNVPTVISSSLYGNKTIKSISASYSNAMALASDGSIYAFGDNSYLQVGDASATTTAKLSMLFSVVPSTYTNITGEYYTSIFQGVGLSVARTNYGRFFMWGDTNVNVCGSSVGSLCSLDGLFKNMSSPFIALPNSHARYNESFLLVATDGCEYTVPLVSRNYTTNCGNASFYSWGSNSYGQIGDRSTADRLSPVAPFTSADFGRERVVEVKYGSYHGVALTVSGKLYSWGLNTGGSLGNTNTTTYTQLTPTIISGIPRTVVSVTCGTASCIALLSDNSMYGWGNNTFGMVSH